MMCYTKNKTNFFQNWKEIKKRKKSIVIDSIDSIESFIKENIFSYPYI